MTQEEARRRTRRVLHTNSRPSPPLLYPKSVLAILLPMRRITRHEEGRHALSDLFPPPTLILPYHALSPLPSSSVLPPLCSQSSAKKKEQENGNERENRESTPLST